MYGELIDRRLVVDPDDGDGCCTRSPPEKIDDKVKTYESSGGPPAAGIVDIASDLPHRYWLVDFSLALIDQQHGIQVQQCAHVDRSDE
jgi:hypothetical protein